MRSRPVASLVVLATLVALLAAAALAPDARHGSRDNRPEGGRHFHAKELPVGWLSRFGGASAFGLEDMLGNVAEWTDSPFLSYPGAPDGVKLNPDVDRVDDRGRIYENTRFVVRGGHDADGLSVLFRTTTRIGGNGHAVMLPSNRWERVGFRCGKWPRPGVDRAYTTWRALSLACLLPTVGRGLDMRPVAFDERGGVGIERTRYVEDDDAHVHVAGETLSIAVLPARRFEAIRGRAPAIALLQTSVPLRVETMDGRDRVVSPGRFVLAVDGAAVLVQEPGLVPRTIGRLADAGVTRVRRGDPPVRRSTVLPGVGAFVEFDVGRSIRARRPASI